jgi:hypothetical protein
MPEFLGPHDHARKGPQRRGKYKWGEWLIPGEHLVFHKRAGEWGKADFPDATADSFRQAAYNAASRMRISISAELPEGPDGTIVEVWVHKEGT